MNIDLTSHALNHAPMDFLDQAFDTLARSLHEALGQPVPQMVGTGDDIRIINLTLEDVPYRILLNRVASREDFFVACEFGNIPAEDTVEVLARLMKMNNMLLLTNSGCFCIDPLTDAILYTFRWPIERTNGEEMMTALTRIFEQAKIWQITYFLDEDSELTESDQPAFSA